MLINCVVYQNGSKLADIPVADISDYTARPDCLVWVALKDPSHEEMAELQAEFGLHALAVEDALKGHQRPKVEEYDDSLFVVLHLLSTGKQGASTIKVGELAVFVGNNYIVSVRTHSERGFTEVRERLQREPDLLKSGPGFVLYALMDAVVDRYFPVADALESELDVIEQRIFDKGAARESIRRLYALKRRLNVLRHAVLPLLEGTSKLHGGRVPTICIGAQDYFRDVVDHLIRINATLDAIRETTVTAIQANLSMVTIEDGEVTKRLAAWASIFAVCTAFAGIWGMNFERMPELKWHYGYPVALGLMFSVCGYLYYRFRKAGWV